QHAREIRRGDAYDPAGDAVETEFLAERRRIAVEAVLPHPVADYHYRIAVGHGVLLRQKEAPQARLNSQHRKIIGRYDRPAGHTRIAINHQVQRRGGVMSGQSFERLAVVTVMDVGRISIVSVPQAITTSLRVH